MATSLEIDVRAPSTDSAGECAVCGDPVPAGSGFTVRVGERDLRFKCVKCLARFERGDEESPASEWTCY